MTWNYLLADSLVSQGIAQMQAQEVRRGLALIREQQVNQREVLVAASFRLMSAALLFLRKRPPASRGSNAGLGIFETRAKDRTPACHPTAISPRP